MRRPESKSALLLDISRLIWRARRRGPTGIDRVELAYARHFLSADGERPAYAVLHLFGFLFAVSPAAPGALSRGFACAGRVPHRRSGGDTWPSSRRIATSSPVSGLLDPGCDKNSAGTRVRRSSWWYRTTMWRAITPLIAFGAVWA